MIPVSLGRICLSLGFIACIVIPAHAQRESRQQQQLETWLKRYPDADVNKDGVLTRAEAVRYRDTVLKERRNNRRGRVAPTKANVKYGPHERNVFDLWLPEEKPETEAGYPVFVYFHGGGFVGGDKSGFDPTPYLDAGLAAVSGNYRFVDGRETLSPAPLHDAARVIQFLRTKADAWRLDGERTCVSGGSAGAVISLWIGYQDDLADQASADPVLRESSRVQCIVPINGPTNLDPEWIHANMGGPPHVHGSFPKMFGAPTSESDRPDVAVRIKETSPIEHLTADDPPTLLLYTGKLEGIPLPETASTGVLIHHPYFGQVLQKRLQELQIPNELHVGFNPRQPEQKQIILNWLDKYLDSSK